MLERNLRVECRGRKRPFSRELLLPLVQFFLERTGKPLWENAAVLVSASFPEIHWKDERKTAYNNLEKSGGRDRFEVPPLHQIERNESRPTRRAVAQILINRAREDLVDMRVDKLREALEARPKAKKKNRVQNETGEVCRAIGCTDKKKSFEKAVAKENHEWIHSDTKAGWFFRCAKCGRIRHSVCDGFVEKSKGDTCKKCAR